MSKHHRVCVIMAGGSGERFWPLSRQMRPKQLLRLTSPDRNLLEETVDRISPMIASEDVYIATARHLAELIRKEGGGVPENNVLAEPCKKNTAGCLAYVAAHLLGHYEADPKELTMAVLSADHRIGDTDAFLRTVETAMAAAEETGCLSVIGVRPSRPETGYGYIEMAEGAAPLSIKADVGVMYPVACFREKPDAATAAEFVATGRFLWNTGMFFWRLDRFMEELTAASPKHAQAVRDMAESMKKNEDAEVDRIFSLLDDISIDYALMEKCKTVAVTPATFEWDDLGAWDALDRAMAHDGDGNIAMGDPVIVDSKDCIVYNEAGPDRMAVVAVGVEGLAIVVREDGVLVVPKDRVQDVRKAITILKARKAPQL